MEDRLQRIRDNYFAGYYQRCIKLAEGIRAQVGELERGELESLVLRASAALNKESGQTPGPSHLDLPTVATVNFLDYWKADSKDRRKLSLDQLREQMRTGDPIVRFLVACALCKEGTETDMSEALNVCGPGPMENELLHTVLLVLANRPDLAQQISEKLTSSNDDAVMTKLALAIVSMVSGNDQEAYLTFGDIEAQCCEGVETDGEASILLLNGKAIAKMQGRQWEDAVEDLNRAHIQDPQNIETVANLIVCYRWLKQEQEAEKHLEFLMNLDPSHPTLVELNKIDRAFSHFRGLKQSA